MKAARIVGLAIVLAISGLLFELRDEGGRIGACASRAVALSQVSELVRQSLYPDTDHFLGNVPRLHEKALLESLEVAYRITWRAAERCRSLFLGTSAAEAREIFLAAMQERNLAASPRGNWISYMSETAKAKTQFETAKARYELDRSAMVRGDAPADVGAVVVLAMAPFTRAVEEAAAALKRETAETERIQAAKLETAAGVAAYGRKVEKLEKEESPPPSRLADSDDFDWKWTVDGAGRPVLTFSNRTRWPIYEIYYGPVGRPAVGYVKRLHPGEETGARVGSAAGGAVVIFTGTFNPVR